MEDPKITNYKIVNLGLSPRTTNALTKSNINTVGDLLALTDKELLSLRGLGLKSFEEVSDIIGQIIDGKATLKPEYYDLHDWIPLNLKERSARAVALNIGLYGNSPIKAIDIAERFGVTRSRIGQILDRAYIKLKTAIQKQDINPQTLARLQAFASKGTKLEDIQGLSNVYDSPAIAVLYAKLIDQIILYQNPNLTSNWIILPDMAPKYQAYIDTALKWLKKQPGFVDIFALSKQSKVPEKIIRNLSSVKIVGDDIALVNGYRKDGIDNAALVRETMLRNIKPMTMQEISEQTGIKMSILRGLIYRIPTVVNIGRSTFGLTDFGYSNKDTGEIVCDYLKACGEPVQIEDVIKHVLHYRVVDPDTVKAAIYNSPDLSRLEDNFIALSEWGYEPASTKATKASYAVPAQDAIMSVLRSADRALSVREISEAIASEFGTRVTTTMVTIAAVLKKLVASGQVEQLGTVSTYYYRLKTDSIPTLF